MTEYTATDATLGIVARGCKPGDRITVSGLWNLTKLNGIRLPDPGIVVEGGEFTGWILSDAKGITIRKAKMQPVPKGAAFGVGGDLCERIVFEDCDLGGLGAVDGGGQGGISKGGVAWRRCRFHDLGQALNLQGGRGHVIEGCDFRDLWSDAITGNPAGDVRVVGNYFTNFRGPPVHLDVFQMFTRAGQAPVTNVLAENNTYDQGEGAPAQFIFWVNEGRVPGGGFRNVVVRGNAMFGGSWHGITIGGYADCPSCADTLVENNFIQGTNEPYVTPGTTNSTVISKPWIRVSWAGWGVTLKNNIGTSVELYPEIDGGGNVNIKSASNRSDRGAFEAFLHRRNPAAPPTPPEPESAPNRPRRENPLDTPAALLLRPAGEDAVTVATVVASLSAIGSRRGVLAMMGLQALGFRMPPGDA